MHAEYKLRCQLHGHSDDVRAVAIAEDSIITGSRDKTIKVWKDLGGTVIEEKSVLVGHTDYIVALAPIKPGQTATLSGPGLVSGSRDTSVFVWDVEHCSVLQQLKGHTYSVSAVGATPGGDICSAGLDGKLIVWKAGKAIRTLPAHEKPILSLLVLPNGDILTGSGDTTIKQWTGNISHATYTGHSDSVRALCLLPDIGFVSGSHDMTLRVWSFAGECISVLVGHTALVFACAATSSGLIASGSEDNTMRLWNASGECLQVVEHPGCVWALGFTPGGDVVSGCSDFTAYVWSANAERQASAESQAQLASIIAERKAMAAAPSGGDLGIPEDKIEEPSALIMPGAKDSDTKFIREGGKVWAYAWVAASMEWTKLGEVTAGPGDDSNMEAPKKWHQGQEWDFLFDVDIADDREHLKLPMNRGEDPYVVADRFIMENMLPIAYREQIVSHILQNAASACGTSSGAPVADPFSGTGYVPNSTPAAPLDFGSAFPDPFTGGGAYVPSAAPTAPTPARPPPSMAVTGGGCDPFTGTSSASAASGALVYTPHREYQLFEAPPAADKVAAKLREFSAAVPADLQLTEAELAPGGGLDQAVAIAASPSASLAGDALETLGKLARWPPAQLFPVLDIFRMFVLSPSIARLLAADAGAIEASNPGLGGMLARGLGGSAPAASQLVGLRLACNCCKHAALRGWLLSNMPALLDFVADLCSACNKNSRVALTTLLLNYGVALANGAVADSSGDGRARVMSILSELLPSIPADEHDSAFRALLAASTTAFEDAESAKLASELGIADAAKEISNRFNAPEKLQVVARDLNSVLSRK